MHKNTKEFMQNFRKRKKNENSPIYLYLPSVVPLSSVQARKRRKRPQAVNRKTGTYWLKATTKIKSQNNKMVIFLGCWLERKIVHILTKFIAFLH